MSREPAGAEGVPRTREQATDIATTPLRVVLADDHMLFRQGLTAILNSDGIDVVGQAVDAQEAIGLAEDLLPDVVVLDIQMPGDGLDAAGCIHDSTPTVPILMLTASDDSADLIAALKAGAVGYLLKTCAPDELSAALVQIASGTSLIDPQMAGTLLREFRNYDLKASRRDRPDLAGRPALTRREVEVLQRLARGRSNRQIATELFISDNTVKNHVRNILDKLQVHTRLEAVVRATRNQVIDLEAELAAGVAQDLALRAS